MIIKLLYSIALASIACGGCSKGEVRLGGGLRLVELDGDNNAIVKNNGEFVVYPNIIKISKNGSIIRGARVKSKYTIDDTDPDFNSGFGDFCIEIRGDNYKFC